jgi:tetratricopeptide (TPR) repeat protein
MGQIINLNTWEEGTPDALTQTGRGGFLSRGYLADEPAIALVEDAETVQYVLTNRKRGVSVESGDSTSHVRPDGSHRTVVVVTDRRLLVLVGREEGDERTSIDFEEITGVEARCGRRNGRLTVTRADGTTWEIATDTKGLDAVAGYLRDAGEAWRHVEELLESVAEDLSEASRLRAAGEFDRALRTARETQEDIEASRSMAITFSTDHPGNALHQRPQSVEVRRRATIAAVRVARARDAAATGDRLFRESNYEAAREAYERAREEYDSALTVEEGGLDDIERIRAECEHVNRVVTGIRESPLPTAITADRAAVAADDAATAATQWETALASYRSALDAHERDEATLFGSDPDQIQDRIETVARNLTAARRTVADESSRAGDWYADAEQYGAALEEFGAAADVLDAALATATENYSDAVPHLEVDRRALQQRIDRARAALNGEAPVEDRIESDDEPDYELSATLGDVDGPTAIADAIDPLTDGTPLAELPESTPECLQGLDETDVASLAGDALDATDWSTTTARPRTPFDLLATRGEERMGVVVHVSENPVTSETVTECADVTGAAGTDAVLLATTAMVSAPVEERASTLGVRLLGCESLAAIVDSEGLTLPVSDAESR